MRGRLKYWLVIANAVWIFGAMQRVLGVVEAGDNVPLQGTQPLAMEGDIASELVDGVNKFLLRQIEASVDSRGRHWKPDFSSAEAYNKSIAPNRQRLAHILGVRD